MNLWEETINRVLEFRVSFPWCLQWRNDYRRNVMPCLSWEGWFLVEFKPVLLVYHLQRCCSLGRLPWRPEIDSGLFSCCQNRKQKEKTEEVNRRCPGGWCNQSHVDWWTSCRRGMELGFDEKQAGGHASSSCLSFLLANAWLYHQSQNSDLASIWCQHRVKFNFEEEYCPRG